jgi:hypothetical protein
MALKIQNGLKITKGLKTPKGLKISNGLKITNGLKTPNFHKMYQNFRFHGLQKYPKIRIFGMHNIWQT